jgi:hypothetical protein
MGWLTSNALHDAAASSPQFFWQGDDGASNRVAHGFSSVSRERRSVLDAQNFAVPHEAELLRR